MYATSVDLAFCWVMLNRITSEKSCYGGGHMTVCVGYEVMNGIRYIYVSDAHKSVYEKQEFRPDIYNDFIATVIPYVEVEVP